MLCAAQSDPRYSTQTGPEYMMKNITRIPDDRSLARISSFARMFGLILTLFLFSIAMAATDPRGPKDGFRIYVHPVNPREHPDYECRHVKPPSWETFGHQTHFTCLRGFGMEGNRLVCYEEELEKYTKTYNLGDVIWPSYPVLFAENLGDLLDAMKERDLYLFDIWGFVPGSGPGGYWQQFQVDPAVFELMEQKLGERWLGMDVGEQDGRYIGGYASMMVPISAGRFDQYLNFQRHFERLCNDLGNKMSTLLSLNFGHHFLKEGVYTLIGAETAQGLPNSQVYYSFIRGAGKQYGVLWFGNASVFNRWGWKSYGPEGKSEGYEYGPTKGTSLSLLKRLLYSHILYNSVTVGFESAWFDSEGKFSPIGRIQQAAQEWVSKNGQPGTMITPIAVMQDFYSGWSFPRHLYTDHVYRVWGNLPYGPGDYLADHVLDMIYPGYQDSSYYHDETGFLTPTPYGDAADCILSDAPDWILRQYQLLIVAGELEGRAEIRDRLENYVQNGGHLLITAGNLMKFPQGIGGIRAGGLPRIYPQGTKILVNNREYTEEQPFELMELESPETSQVLASCKGKPVAVRVKHGQGVITVLGSPFGISSEPACKDPIKSEIDKPLPKPYPLLEHVRVLTDEYFRSQVLFEAGDGLGWITCRKGEGDYLLGVFNNSYQQKPFEIVSHCGDVLGIEEDPLDQSEKSSVGHLPESVSESDIGTSDATHIAGGDVRLFRIRTRETSVKVIRDEKPPKRPTGRILFLRDITSIKEAVLYRPTFFQHFDGVMVDWRYLRNCERRTIEEESGWIARQGLRVVVDLSPGLNLYPDLRLVENMADEYTASMAAIRDVIEKMALLGSHDLVMSLHRTPENNYTQEQTRKDFEKSLSEICRLSGESGITVHLRVSPDKPPYSVAEAQQVVKSVGAPNLRIAVCAAALLAGNGSVEDSLSPAKDQVGLLLVAMPGFDVGGKLWSVHEHLAGNPSVESLCKILRMLPDMPVVLDCVYSDRDEEYADAVVLEGFAVEK